MLIEKQTFRLSIESTVKESKTPWKKWQFWARINIKRYYNQCFDCFVNSFWQHQSSALQTQRIIIYTDLCFKQQTIYQVLWSSNSLGLVAMNDEISVWTVNLFCGFGKESRFRTQTIEKFSHSMWHWK